MNRGAFLSPAASFLCALNIIVKISQTSKTDWKMHRNRIVKEKDGMQKSLLHNLTSSDEFSETFYHETAICEYVCMCVIHTTNNFID